MGPSEDMADVSSSRILKTDDLSLDTFETNVTAFPELLSYLFILWKCLAAGFAWRSIHEPNSFEQDIGVQI